jgi:hypothetical protein
MNKLTQNLINNKLMVSEGGPIESLLVGGSAAYSNYEDISSYRDIDFLLLVRCKADFQTLFVEKKSILNKSLEIVKEECHVTLFDACLTSKHEKYKLDNYIDAVRYVGFTETGQKRSIKAVNSMYFKNEYNCNDDESFLRVLSTKKNTIICNNKSIIFFVNRKITSAIFDALNFNINIIGDPIIKIHGDSKMSVDLNDIQLGIISDMIISGRVLYDPLKHFDFIRRILLGKIRHVLNNDRKLKNWYKILVRNAHFDKNYKKVLNSEFERIMSMKLIEEDENDFQVNLRSVNLYSFMTQNVFDLEYLKIPKFNCKSIWSDYEQQVQYFQLLKYVDESCLDFKITESSYFPTVSKYGQLSLLDTDISIKAFFKKTQNWKNENYISNEARKYFEAIQPLSVCYPKLETCLYLWIDGITVANLRFKILKQIWSDKENFDIFKVLTENNDDEIRIWSKLLIESEIYRTECVLQSYIKSSNVSANKSSNIHELFYKRLTNNRLEKFYSNLELKFLDTCGSEFTKLTFDKFIHIPFIINGDKYESLFHHIEIAKLTLSPDFLKHLPICFGLSDLHGGNVMITEKSNMTVFIDYEYGGYHCPFLDLVKPLFIDTFFNAYMFDALDKSDSFAGIDIKIFSDDDNSKFIIINHQFFLDSLSKFFFNAKLKGIIEPLVKFYKEKFCLDDAKLHDCTRVLLVGMFTCALYSRKFEQDKHFMLMVALAIQIASKNNLIFDEFL